MNSYVQKKVAPGLFEVEMEQALPELQLEGELAGAQLAEVVRVNRVLARRIGWGCVIGGRVSPIPQVRNLLRLGNNPTEENLARSIANWQQAQTGRRGDGQLGPRTWRQMGVLPRPNFRQASWPVFFGGQQLGILEKTAPYLNCYFDPVPRADCRRNRSGIAGERGGAKIEMGFRVTNMDSVRRAQFVDATGEDNFRWIQVVNFITIPGALPGTYIRRATRTIDPTTLVGAQPDPHPYYWDWDRHTPTPPGFNDHFHIRHFLDRPARNGLCYDLIFWDTPQFRLTTAYPGHRAYFDFELALVGVRPGNRNVILNTVRWGFDIVIRSGLAEVGLAAIRPGQRGGSDRFRQTLSRAVRAGEFPGHCFVGPGFMSGARCP